MSEPVLQKGSTDPAVRDLQEAMKALSANRAGREGAERSAGHSRLVNSHGDALTRADLTTEQPRFPMIQNNSGPPQGPADEFGTS